jgi:trehalose-6-phosphatase
MTAQLIHKDITLLNTRMLSCVQNLFKESPAEAMVRTGMSMASLEKLSAMPTDDIEAIANNGRLVFNLEDALLQPGQAH